MRTRKASNIDCVAITELTSELGYQGSVSDISNLLSNIQQRDDNIVYVAEDDNNKVIGWIQIHTSHILGPGFCAEIVILYFANYSLRSSYI